jgi:hypothetical protein
VTAGAECRIQSLDVSRADFARFRQQIHELGHASLNQTLVYSNHASPLVLFYHLGYHHFFPGDKRGATPLPGTHGFAKGISPGLDIAAKTIGDKQEGSLFGALLDLCRQLLEHSLVPGARDNPAQPEARRNTKSHRHPEHLTLLEFDIHLVGLHLNQVHRLLRHLRFMEPLAMGARLLPPTANRSFVQLESDDYRLQGTTQREQRYDKGKGLWRILLAVKQSSLSGAESLLAGSATPTLAQAIMDAEVSSILETS